MKKLTAIVMGYGMRGQSYSSYAIDNPEKLEIVAVAEPEKSRRLYAQRRHNLSEDMLFDDWEKLAELPKMADFAIISTQDKMHLEPALACIEKGYDLLLEKPMAPTAEECKIIYEAAEKKGVKVVVCHVLRFTPFWYKLKELLDEGAIGEVRSIIHMENVGNMHYSHSYVRGNWRNTAESSAMILAKSCHDTDIVQWLLGKDCKKVQSFGSYSVFTKENQPKGAPDRCLDGCPYMDSCLYNPVKFYVEDKENGWRDTVADKVDATDEEITEALRTGPYGRCVYACDNDVVDHQVVNMEFDGGATVSFTMSAFNKGGRFIRIFGTKGEIVASHANSEITVCPFGKPNYVAEIDKIGESITSGHGGGDTGIMVDSVKYFNNEQPSKSVCDLRTSYLNHLICFAAEKSRAEDSVVDLDKFSESV
ncbi:MAG: Gfo/Idh/MocA family oxidoreductase [Clostridia bacterium]|nr:Gfo/Idh/MocA family oxidoreductase [Clostridia bacterium]